MTADEHSVRRLPPAKDMAHHVNRITKNRKLNSLKEMYKYAQMEGMISMAGGEWVRPNTSLPAGLPSPELFPFEALSANILPHDHLPLDPPRVPSKPKKSLLSWLLGGSNVNFTIPKYADDPKDPMAIQLATSLQYQAATGPPAFPKFLRRYVETIFRPAYADWDVLLDVGATDGFGKVFNMLLELGDSILVEEWSYPGAMNAYEPFEVNVVALKMDGQGVLPDYMEETLANWDDTKGKRPRVFYTVPTGQNPTGATMLGERKKAIYDICAKYDIVIVEDDPYYTLFVGDWIPQGRRATPLAQRLADAERKEGKEGQDAFLKSLPPSYLTFDTEGRVIRLDVSSPLARAEIADFFEDILSRLTPWLDHLVAHLHRAPHSNCRGKHAGTQWLCHCTDNYTSQHLGLGRIPTLAARYQGHLSYAPELDVRCFGRQIPSGVRRRVVKRTCSEHPRNWTWSNRLPEVFQSF